MDVEPIVFHVSGDEDSFGTGGHEFETRIDPIFLFVDFLIVFHRYTYL